MRDFQNAFDVALAGADNMIVEVMRLCAQFTPGAQCGSEVQGVFDDPESPGLAGGRARIEGSSLLLFVQTDTVRAVRRGDMLTINGEVFWVDRVSPDDGGSCYLQFNRGQPPAVNRRRQTQGEIMAIKGLDQAINNLGRVRKNAIPAASAMIINRVAATAINQSSSQVAWETKVCWKLVKERSRLKRATVRNPNVRIIVNRGNPPVTKLRIRMLGRRPSSVLKVGQYRYQRAFIQRLKNGRWHVMQRVTGKDRYPIDVVKIPVAVLLKQVFDKNADRTRCERLPKELTYVLKQRLRTVIKR